MPHDLAQETYTYILMSTEKGFFAVTMAIRYCCRPDQLRQPDRKIYKLGPWNHCFSPTGSHLPCDIQSTIVDSNHLRKRQHIKSEHNVRQYFTALWPLTHYFPALLFKKAQLFTVTQFMEHIPPTLRWDFLCDLWSTQRAVCGDHVSNSLTSTFYPQWVSLCTDLQVDQQLQTLGLPTINIFQMFGHRIRNGYHSIRDSVR